MHLHLLSSYSFSSTLLSSNISLLSASSLLCFSSVHIVGSLTSKLPSIIFIHISQANQPMFHRNFPNFLLVDRGEPFTMTFTHGTKPVISPRSGELWCVSFERKAVERRSSETFRWEINGAIDLVPGDP